VSWVRDHDSLLGGERAPGGPSATSRTQLTNPVVPPSANTQSRVIDRVPPELLRQPCHLLPIRKRAEGSFLQNVSVGRARNHDIVLRHRSVSKFHAWFEVHEDSRLSVKDQESRNHTFVDGQQVANRVDVQPGQTIRFGSVEARVCTPESIWRALHP
jgi:pSer/pThr/pTyr-binding forkhead associated (FHA) protein